MKIRINLTPKFMAEGSSGDGPVGFEKEDNTEPVEDFHWDQGEIGSWHKEDGNHGNEASHVTDSTSSEVPSPVHQEKQPNDEILTEWDSQFDFCLKDSPQSSPVKSKSKKEGNQKSPKVRVKDVFFKGKDFVKSKVNSCKEKFSRNSMKESKKKAKHSTAENDRKNGEECSVSERGDNSTGFKKGDNSGQNGGQSEPKSLVMTSEKGGVIVSQQNGHSNNNSGSDYMTLPEAYTSYDCVKAQNRESEDANGNPSVKQRETLHNGNGKQSEEETNKSMDDPENKQKVPFMFVEEEDILGFKDQPVPQDQGQVKVVLEEAENKALNGTDDDQRVLEEAIPLGSEAQSFEKTNGSETVQLEVPVDKRLKWLLGNLEQASFGSDLSQNTATSTSSDISVDMLLQERSNDPEQILTNLGFGDANEDNPTERIPDRFKDISCSETAPNIFSDNPELTQLLHAFTSQQEAAGTSDLQQGTNMEAIMTGHGNTNYNSMLNSVMHGMKFLNFLNKQGFNADKAAEHPSILQNPKNREFLQKQGYYDKHNPQSKSGDDSKTNKLTRSQSLDASEKRKRFQATKSRNYSSLTNVPEQEEMPYSRRNFQSYNASFDTAQTSTASFDYGRSMTSIETSTDSFDSGDSTERRRRDIVRPDPLPVTPLQSNIGDSGIWNTQDSTRSIDDEYLTDFSRESARQRRTDVTKMMSGDNYSVGDDADILKSPPLSRTPSLEATLTSGSFQKLQAKSSTLKDSLDDDLDMYSEKYLCDVEANRSHIVQNGNNLGIKPEKSNPQFSVQPTKSGWQKFQRRYGVEMSVRVPGDRMEYNFPKKSCDSGDNVDSGIPMDQVSSERSLDKNDRPDLGSIGKIESVQSDSSGFAEAETNMPEPQVIQKVSSMGSSTESDQTFKSSITILPTKSSVPKMSVTSPEDKLNSSLNKSQNLSMDASNCGSEDSPSVSRIDIAVGTDDFSEFLHTPTVSYHIHERDTEDSGTCSENDKSVILTIELPKKWVNTNPNRREGKPRVISHLYKEIGHPSRSASIDLDSHTGGAFSVYQRGQSDYPLIRTVSDGNVPMEFPNRSSTPYGQMSSTPYGKPPIFRHHPDLRPSHLSPRSTSPCLSVYSDYGPGHVNYQSEHSLNFSSASLVSKTESVASLCNNSLEYYKLMKLVNQPVSFKADSSGHKGIIRFEPKFSIKKWTQLRKQQQLEEETKLVQHTLQKYKAELNVMESQFLVKTQLVQEDLSYGDREDVQELQYLWSELRKEVLLMEQTLANRLSGIKIGNDNYNPLLALDVVRKMTELLREQIYLQQMANEKDEEAMETTHSATLWPSSTNLDTKHSMSDLGSDHSYNSSLAELKETILTEVRQELHDNTQWLHKELQKKERELNALKMELMANNINTGATRKKHFYESDV